MTDITAQLWALVVCCFIAQVYCSCSIGFLTPVSGSSWLVTERREVYSIIPQIIPPSVKTESFKSILRPSELKLIAEVRPASPPSSQARICLRSIATTAGACAANKPAPAADVPQPTDPKSFIYNATEGTPLGPCMEILRDGSSASLVIETPRPPSCWPGAGYCSERLNTWKLSKNVTTAGKHQFVLSISRVSSTYQDTDGSIYNWTAELPFTVAAGCVLGTQASTAAAEQGDGYCISCSGTNMSLSSITTSQSCMRCPIRSSKSRDALSTVGPAATYWKCIPGMPKGFETVPVRMGLGGHPECASINGKTCLRNLTNAATCQAMLPILNRGVAGTPSSSSGSKAKVSAGVVLQPLKCGAAHAARWDGVTGYKTPGHWCIVAREWFQDLQPTVLGKCIVKP